MYKTLIWGAGNQGALNDIPGSKNEYKVISYAHALKLNGNFDVRVYDNNSERMETAIRAWNLKPIDTEFIPDVHIIATPDGTHYEILKALVKTKPLLMVCEKPLCMKASEAIEIAELYKKHNIPLMVDYSRRFIKYYQDLKQRYISGEFGKLLKMSGKYNKGQLHTGTHMLDFFWWFTDKKLLRFNHSSQAVMEEVFDIPYRVWEMQLYFEDYFWQEQRIKDMPVWGYCDNMMMDVVDGIYNFLNGGPIICSGEEAASLITYFEGGHYL